MRRSGPLPLTLDDFEGCWSFERTVLHATGDRAVMTGRAIFRADAEGLVQDEAGQMSVNGGPPMAASQRYLWREGLVVLFADGRPFHCVPPRGGDASHRCDPDSYTVRYVFERWPDWRADWTVKGPSKDYRMVTRYTRERD